jgi:SAM-dependent methyltransferase
MQLSPTVDPSAGAAVSRIPPVLLAVPAHALAWAGVTAAMPMLSGWGEPGLALAVGQGLLAAICGRLLRLRAWWFVLNLVFPPAVYCTQSLALDPDWFLVAFLLLVLLFWSTYRSQVPLYLSSREACERLSELLPKTAGVRTLDLGSGFGGVLAWLGRHRPDCRFDGVELAPLPALLAWLRTRRMRNCTAVRGDFWQRDLAGYDVVYAFLSPAAMPDLWRKARVEMKPGSLLVSNSFPIHGVEPHAVVPLSGHGSRALYLWHM